jgi:hypothetical protein
MLILLHAEKHVSDSTGIRRSRVAFDPWIQCLNRIRATGHRWRKQFPWLKSVNIFGRLYICRKTIEEFERPALAGEFQKDIRPNVNP